MSTRLAHLKDALATILALTLGLVVVFPVLYGILGAFKTPAEFAAYPPQVIPKRFTYLENFRAVLAMIPYARYMLNSVLVAGLATTVRLLLALLAAFTFVFYAFKGQKTLFLLILGTMMLPGDTLILSNYLTVTRLGLLDTYLGMAITAFVGASQMFMLRQNFKILPPALREAGQIDGCGDFQFILRILLPIARPVLLTLLVQSFVTQWNAYLWPLLVTNQNTMRTIQVGITMLTTLDGTNYTVVLAGVALTLVPAFALFLMLRRNIVKGITAGALVG